MTTETRQSEQTTSLLNRSNGSRINTPNGIIAATRSDPVEAETVCQQAFRLTRREWSRGWRKPKLKKAGDLYCKVCYSCRGRSERVYDLFFQAALLYHQSGEAKAARGCLLHAYECYKRKRAWYPAAKTLEQAIIIAQEKVRAKPERSRSEAKRSKKAMAYFGRLSLQP